MKPHKQRMTNFARLALALSLAFNPLASLAQGDHHSGGGEDGVFKNIRDEIGVWMSKNVELGKLEEKLELKSFTGQEFYDLYGKAVRDVGEKIVFNNEEIRFGDNVRICENDRDAKLIHCNIAMWNATRGDTRYMVVLHEYLGIANIETNVEKYYSSYPYSPKILGFVKTVEAFELGMERTGYVVTAAPQPADFACKEVYANWLKKKHKYGLFRASSILVPWTFGIYLGIANPILYVIPIASVTKAAFTQLKTNDVEEAFAILNAAAIGTAALVDNENRNRYATYQMELEGGLAARNRERARAGLEPLTMDQYVAMTSLRFVPVPRELVKTRLDALSDQIYFTTGPFSNANRGVRRTGEELEEVIRSHSKDDTYCPNGKPLTENKLLKLLRKQL